MANGKGPCWIDPCKAEKGARPNEKYARDIPAGPRYATVIAAIYARQPP